MKFIFILIFSLNIKGQTSVAYRELRENHFLEKETLLTHKTKNNLSIGAKYSEREYDKTTFIDRSLFLSKRFDFGNYELTPIINIGPKNKIKEESSVEFMHNFITDESQYIITHKNSNYKIGKSFTTNLSYYKYFSKKIEFLYSGLIYSKNDTQDASSLMLGLGLKIYSYRLNLRISKGQEIMDATNKRDFSSVSVNIKNTNFSIPSINLGKSYFKNNTQLSLGIGYIWIY